MENLSLGLTLMCIGMLTVFAILIIVINMSKVLISIVNKVCPEEETAKKSKSAAPQQAPIDATVMSIINATVSQLTGGKGHVSKVERL